jgi:mRNA-degrading endonuclease RelE of RelBE toxin-antitoxin system
MNWDYEFTKDAENDLKKLPRHIQHRVARTLASMTGNPLQGDVKSLAGPEWKGVFRRRIGSYRMFFAINPATQKIIILRVLIRSEKTYR